MSDYPHKKSTRTHFMGKATKLEADKKGRLHGKYHDTEVATKTKKGDLHFRTGGYLTNTTVRRMQAFAREHGGRHSLSFSRKGGKLQANDYASGEKYSSGEKGGEHRMTVKSAALAKRTKN